jgi:hypothetical protein
VYDLIYPTQTATHLLTIGELDDQSIDSTKLLSSFASADESQLEEEVNLDCSTGRGRETYLEKRAPTLMTKKAIETNKPWPKRNDGLRHASLPVNMRHCQYCYFQYTYDFDDSQREVNLIMQRNRAHMRQCLVCNVNLCSICEIEFHGVRMCESAKLLGK